MQVGNTMEPNESTGNSAGCVSCLISFTSDVITPRTNALKTSEI